MKAASPSTFGLVVEPGKLGFFAWRSGREALSSIVGMHAISLKHITLPFSIQPV